MNEDRTNSLTPEPLAVPQPLSEVLGYAEEYCVCSCCGFDALNLDVGRTREWVISESIESARLALRQVRELIARLNETRCRSGIAHSWNGLSPSDLLTALEVIESNLEVNLPK